ncbi:MAG: carboxypeptidase regulatory-like domain-containing protein [Bryobacteraceae bacterium]|nr:carboxypeptidase regulatory-like domain-containing protein [Bryobacteraceae bacterium]
MAHRIQRSSTSVIMAVLTVLAMAQPAFPQTITATLIGTVRDTSDAILVKASIRALHTQTGVIRLATTDAEGNYTLTNLATGQYAVSAQAPGFRKMEQTGITLQLEQRARVDFRLPVGEVSETVNVVAEATAVQAYTTDRNQSIENRRVVSLPLNGRVYTDLMKLAPGAIDTNPGRSSDGYVGKPGVVLSNVLSSQNRFFLDGAANRDQLDNVPSLNPSIDAIQEFNVKVNSYSAEYAGGGGVLNATIKSGTNELHGSLFEFFRNEKLDARPYQFGPARLKNAFRYNQFGGVLGGPVLLPRIYDGRNRSFFLFNYEGIRRRDPSDQFARVPTGAEREGDFRGQAQVYDPFNLSPATGERVPFAENRIPQSRWNTYVGRILPFWPAANLPLDALNRNYFISVANKTDTDQYIVRGDQVVSNRLTVFGRYGWSDEVAVSPGAFAQIGGTASQLDSKNLVAGATATLTPRILTEFRFGFSSRLSESTPQISDRNFDAELGFPIGSNLTAEDYGFPGIGIRGLSGLGGLTKSTTGPNRTWQVTQTLTAVLGAHNVKAGFSMERYFNFYRLIFPRNFSFQGNLTALVRDGRFQPNTGAPFADFLLGAPSALQVMPVLPGVGREPNQTLSASYAAFVQDEWRVTRRLSLSLGLRYEVNMPPFEKNNRTLVSEILDEAGPGGVRGVVLYPKDLEVADTFLSPQFIRPVTQPGNPQVLSGQFFRRADTNRVWDTDKNNFQPRLGFAYRPLSTDRFVMRGNYGIYNAANTGRLAFASGLGSPFLLQIEERQDETIPPTRLRLGEFPETLFTPGGITVYNLATRKNPDPFLQNWFFGLEGEPVRNLIVEAAYVGNRADNLTRLLTINERLNPGLNGDLRVGCGAGPEPAGLRAGNPSVGSCPTRLDPATGFQIVDRPFPRPYPAFGETRTRGPFGWSDYHALQLRVERRFSQGLTFFSTYTFGKSMTTWDQGLSDGDSQRTGQADGTARNVFLLDAEKARAAFSAKHVWVTNWIYELPFGRGKLIGSGSGRLLNSMVGGWQVAGILSVQSGFPFGVYTPGDISGTGVTRGPADRLADGNLPASERTLDRWFDTSAFVLPRLNTFGNSGRNILWSPNYRNLDFSVLKNFELLENKQVQFRSEFFNLSNTPNFGIPDRFVTNPNYGRITSTRGSMRVIQLALKVVF